jgi:cyclopropane fatty-acyl-phospholipid synthase-like methyltransferase
MPFLRSSRPKARHGLVGLPALWEMKRQFQIQFLKQAGLSPHHFLLDIGCGSLRGGIPIIELLESGHYYGIDVRAEVLEEARKELRESGLETKQPQVLLIRDPAEVQLPQRFDFMWAFSVLFHMTDPILENCMAMVRRQLQPTGAFFANVALGKGQGSWREFPVVERSMQTYSALAARHGLTVVELGSMEGFGHHSGEPYQDRQPMVKFSLIDGAATT